MKAQLSLGCSAQRHPCFRNTESELTRSSAPTLQVAEYRLTEVGVFAKEPNHCSRPSCSPERFIIAALAAVEPVSCVTNKCSIVASNPSSMTKGPASRLIALQTLWSISERSVGAVTAANARVNTPDPHKPEQRLSEQRQIELCVAMMDPHVTVALPTIRLMLRKLRL